MATFNVLLTAIAMTEETITLTQILRYLLVFDSYQMMSSVADSVAAFAATVLI